MFIVAQFPVIDLRPFAADVPSRTTKPTWPTAIVNTHFVRSTGGVIQRPRRGVGGWVAEDTLCDARRAIALVPAQPDDPTRTQLVFRRLYASGLAGTRIELGCVVRPSWARFVNNPIGPPLNDVFALRWRIRSLPLQSCELSQLSGPLAKLYCQRTTRHAAAPEPLLVRAGMPLLFCEDSSEGCLPRIARQERMEHLPQHNIAVGNRSLRGVEWRLIAAARPADASLQRNARLLRLVLMRKHADRQTFRLVLSAMAAGDIAPALNSKSSERLHTYLIKACRTLLRRHDEPLEEGIQTALGVDDFAFASDRDALRNGLDAVDLRPRVRKRIDEVLDAENAAPRQTNMSVQVTGGSGVTIVTVAEHIQGVVNSVQQSLQDQQAKVETRSAASDLLAAIKALPAGIKPELQMQLTRDLAALSGETRPRVRDALIGEMLTVIAELGEPAQPVRAALQAMAKAL